jgi:hypothetical protein
VYIVVGGRGRLGGGSGGGFVFLGQTTRPSLPLARQELAREAQPQAPVAALAVRLAEILVQSGEFGVSEALALGLCFPAGAAAKQGGRVSIYRQRAIPSCEPSSTALTFLQGAASRRPRGWEESC